MKKTLFTETQIVLVLREADKGTKIEEVCRNHGISSATYYNWKSKYSGMEALTQQLEKSPRSGFWRCYDRLRLKGYAFNYKRVYRVYCLTGLNLKRRAKKVLPKRVAMPLEVMAAPNVQWPWILCMTACIAAGRFAR